MSDLSRMGCLNCVRGEVTVGADVAGTQPPQAQQGGGGVRTIRLLVDLTCDESYFFGLSDDEGMRLLVDEVLLDPHHEGLVLHSNYIGDEVGSVRVIAYNGLGE